MNLPFTQQAAIPTDGRILNMTRLLREAFLHNMTTINNSTDLLAFIINQANSGSKNWFGFQQQRIAGIDAAYKMAIAHGDKMSPEEIVDYVIKLNNTIYDKMLRG